MLPSTYTNPIIADYESDIVELYIMATKICVETGRDLAILSLILDHSRRSNPGLPSWVPQFYEIARQPIDRPLGFNRRRPKSPPYSAAYHSKQCLCIVFIRDAVLRLRGCKHPAPVELGECFHNWIVQVLIEIRRTAEKWPEKLTKICEELTRLSAERA
jgi:hypothetical protein